jgi:L-seryl-tRNA(Ser) seleniumtransferase
MTPEFSADPRRALPSVDRLLAHPVADRLLGLYGRDAVVATAREVLEATRQELAGQKPAGGAVSEFESHLVDRIGERLDRRLGARMQPVLNATGIFLHTNLGRAPLPDEAVDELALLAPGYCDLEFDLDSGERGDRNRRATALLRAVTGAEAALVVNNNAAALLLVLSALARGREVILSRGELVEIGGSFRIPEILAAANVRLVEVGTTNRTQSADYDGAVTEETAILLKVEPSNFRISGFVSSVDASALADLAHRHDLIAIVDQGSGLLRPHPAAQLHEYASARELLARGVDLVCCSGDKLLGGPQAGLLLGRRDLIATCHRHPVYRAVRPGRLTLIALEAVLRRHLRHESMPLDRLWPNPESHRRRITAVAARLRAGIVIGEAYVGGGSAPEQAIPGEVLALPGGERLARELRLGDPPAVGYVKNDQLILDLRTVPEVRDGELAGVVQRAQAALTRRG